MANRGRAACVYTHVSNAFKTYVVAAAPAAAVALALTLTTTGTAAAQAQKPSFGGVWTFTAPAAKPDSGGGVAALPPAPITIRHTAKSIAIDRTAFGEVTTMTFSIDGAQDDKNRTGAQAWTTRTRWEGKALVTTGTIAQSTSAGFEEWTYTETRSLDTRGHMIVETKHVALDGKVTTGKQDWAPASGKANGSMDR